MLYNVVVCVECIKVINVKFQGLEQFVIGASLTLFDTGSGRLLQSSSTPCFASRCQKNLCSLNQCVSFAASSRMCNQISPPPIAKSLVLVILCYLSLRSLITGRSQKQHVHT